MINCGGRWSKVKLVSLIVLLSEFVSNGISVADGATGSSEQCNGEDKSSEANIQILREFCCEFLQKNGPFDKPGAD